jgi:hypothetical protein
MAYNTLTQQGLFTSTGVAKTIVMRSDVDWMMTWNLTAMADTTQWESVRHYWQRELPAGDHMIDYHAAASQAISMSTGLIGYNGVVRPGFYPIDSSAVTAQAPIAVTAGTNATRPVYSTANTGVLTAGAIVRVYGGAHTNINGLDFTVDTVVANTSFRLANTLATAPGVINGAGFWRYVAPDLATYKLFRPQNRVIANITAANPAVVTTLVDHGYNTGDLVRFRVPAGNGMVEMNGLTGTVTVLTASTFSVDIDSTAFTAFAFPLPAAVPFTPAEVTPVGESNVNTLNDAVSNQGYIGIVLAGGQGSPAGENGDVIKWLAGKSFHTFTP